MSQSALLGDRHGTELNFKFYRQATDKIIGISAGGVVPQHVLLTLSDRGRIDKLG